MALHLSTKTGAQLTRKSEETVNNLNAYWTARDSFRKNLETLRDERLKDEKELDAIDFELTKGEYKLDQAERRLRVVTADIEELDYQLEKLEQDGTFPHSIWSIKDTVS
jgi:chromosome segregation ATPase